MVNRIELAERRYKDIITSKLVGLERPERDFEFPVSKILAWINNYVLPAADEVWLRPVFRDKATWPQRTLVADSATPERAAVERVDDALVAEAMALKKLTKNAAVARKLAERAAAAKTRHEGEPVEVGNDGVRWVSRHLEKDELIQYYVGQLESMAGRCWTDLVCVEDYFGPVGGMMRTTPLPPGVTDGSFVVSLSPHLFSVGDSITRCLMQRIRSWMAFLSEARSVVYEAVRATKRPYVNQASAEQAAWTELQQAIDHLQLLCLTGREARLREASITLVQVYTEFHPNPELDWVGVKGEVARSFKGLLTMNITGTRELETVERIAGALGDLKLLYEDLKPGDSEIDAAVATGGLVLVEKDRKAFWQRELIGRDWSDRKSRNHWTMLWKLGIRAKAGSPLGNFDIYLTAKANTTIHSRASRLKLLLPASLREHIQPGAEQATYRLTLPINQIHLFPASRPASAEPAR